MDTESTSNRGRTRTGNSYIQTFLSCRRKFYWQEVYQGGLTPKEESPNLTIGRAVHEALATWHTYQDLPLSLKALELVIPQSSPSYGLALATFVGYTKAYPREQSLEFLVQEFETSIKVGEFTYTMRIDGIARYLNEFYVVEHKTTGQSLKSYFNHYENDRQVTGYLLGVKAEMPSMRVAGIVINALKKPAKLKTGYGEPAYDRAIILRTDRQMSWWLNDTISIFEDIGRCYYETGDWYCNTKECYAFNAPCPYISLCKYGPLPALMGEFTIREAKK